MACKVLGLLLELPLDLLVVVAIEDFDDVVLQPHVVNILFFDVHHLYADRLLAIFLMRVFRQVIA